MGSYGGSMKKRVILKGPLLTRSGYGEQSRFALRALRSRPDEFEVYIQPLTWGKTSWLHEQDEERAFIDQTIEKTIAFIQQGGRFDISIQCTIPNEFENMATVNIGYTAGIEATAVSAVWLQKINEIVERVIVVSSFSTEAFRRSEYSGEMNGQPANLKLQKPIDFVNYPVKEYENLPELQLDLDFDFNFVSVAQWGPRKNLPNTVKWFVEEFHDEEVGLVLKSNLAKNCIIDRTFLLEKLREELAMNWPNRKCKIYLLHGDMSEEEMHSLYVHPKISAGLFLPHGEGFGLPIFEAAYSGLPVVATGWSGHLDFLVDEGGSEHFYNVAFDANDIPESVVWEDVLIKEAKWAYPREASAKQRMRECYSDITSGKEMDACNYALELKDRFSADKMYSKFAGLVLESAPEGTVVNDMDEIEKLFSEAL
jgi:glycosyltransferase involved in cell wall biosynthesis